MTILSLSSEGPFREREMHMPHTQWDRKMSKGEGASKSLEPRGAATAWGAIQTFFFLTKILVQDVVTISKGCNRFLIGVAQVTKQKGPFLKAGLLNHKSLGEQRLQAQWIADRAAIGKSLRPLSCRSALNNRPVSDRTSSTVVANG